MVRSQTRREWGLSLDETNATQCVRRFGLPTEGTRTTDLQVTACKLSESNGRDLLVTYSQEDVYLFDILGGEPETPESPQIPPSAAAPKRKRSSSSLLEPTAAPPASSPPGPLSSAAASTSTDGTADAAEPVQRSVASRLQAIRDRKHAIDGDAPVIRPIRRYGGHRNCDTVKDVNFGFSDTLVLSGSDDGRLFAWTKTTGELVGIWDGDGSVVNVRRRRSASR